MEVLALTEISFHSMKFNTHFTVMIIIVHLTTLQMLGGQSYIL